MPSEIKFDPRININRLHEEWLGQPDMFWTWSRRLADKKRELREAEQELKVTEAEMQNAIRSDPLQYGLTKDTETAIKAAVLASKEMQHAQGIVNALLHEVDVHSAAVSTLGQRKSALSDLVKLHIANYFATGSGAPGSIPAEVTKEVVRTAHLKDVVGDEDDLGGWNT